MSHLQQAQLASLRSDLLRERDELARRLEASDKFGMNEPMGIELGELSLYDNHPGDIGSEMFERGKDLALAELWEHQLEKAEAALARIDAGTYGHCLRCGEPIPLERLQALPSAEYCVKHVPDDDTSYRRPREEKFLAPAMRSDMDHDDTTQFDGEDAWQIVERWGTSNTPALQEGRDNTDYNDMEIEADENEGYVEPLESFLATDMYGNNVTFIRNDVYQKYLEQGEGYGLLEPDAYEDGDMRDGYF
ncbi:TraR/DksA C4-type zinc finger protein [Paenibacillus sp.]|uniref:TraR/DksA C4-type zinc finger protein n=1 Tax=Paenibacillus sp. TaxID=58172 RepID=UPI002D4A8854|nr:TraR/DksA C4-type zinc finger protein [Paenibacillus sp.]HZG55166.1 TraR/DksA C4-type zinc finger protein [Paenibacillus sp.]